MPNYLTDFYQEVRETYNNNYRSTQIEDRFLQAGKNLACRAISKFNPRVNQRADITIIANATSVALPANFLSCSLSAIYKLKYNQKLEDISQQDLSINIYNKQTYYSNNSYNSRFTPEGRVKYIPRSISNLISNTDNANAFKIEIFQNDTKTFSLWFDEDQSVSARTEKNFSYNAIHQIETDKDTITQDIRNEFIDLVLHYTCLEAQRQLAKEDKSQASKTFGEQAIFYSRSINNLASLGMAD